MSTARASRAQRGFALIAALFVLVVLAALGAFAVHINMMQQHDAGLELAGGARSGGIERRSRVRRDAACSLPAPTAARWPISTISLAGLQ